MRLLLIISLPLLLSACGIMTPAQNPEWNIAEAHEIGATEIAFDADGSRLASGGLLGEIKLWSIPGGKMLLQAKSHRREPVTGLAWSDRGTVISTAKDGRIAVTELQSLRIRRKLETGTPIVTMAYHARNRTVAIGHIDGTIRLLSYPELEPLAEKRLGSKPLSLAFDPAGERLAASTETERVYLLDSELNELPPLTQAEHKAFSLHFTPDGQTLAAGTWYRLLLWDLTSGKLEIRETEHAGKVTSIDFSPDGNMIASVGRHTDAHIRWSETATGKVIRRLAPLNLCGYSIRVSPDGRYIATSSDDESIRLYDVAKPYSPTTHRTVTGWE